jgi:hypothetical protein
MHNSRYQAVKDDLREYFLAIRNFTYQDLDLPPLYPVLRKVGGRGSGRTRAGAAAQGRQPSTWNGGGRG